jgi:hypothetical protein
MALRRGDQDARANGSAGTIAAWGDGPRQIEDRVSYYLDRAEELRDMARGLKDPLWRGR